MPIPSLVREMCGAYLEAVDRDRPGLVSGFYLVGSLALGGFRLPRSDVDFVALTSRASSAEDVGALEEVHGGLELRRRGPRFDGLYLSLAQLSADPGALAGCPSVQGRTVTTSGPQPDAMSLHILGRHGLALRGPDREELGISYGPDVLRDATAAQIRNHWRPWVARLRFSPGGLRAGPIQTGVLALPRIHYTLSTGEIATKEAAARYAAHHFSPRWHGILDEALRCRAMGGGLGGYRTPMGRRRDAVAFMTMVLDDIESRLRP